MPKTSVLGRSNNKCQRDIICTKCLFETHLNLTRVDKTLNAGP